MFPSPLKFEERRFPRQVVLSRWLCPLPGGAPVFPPPLGAPWRFSGVCLRVAAGVGEGVRRRGAQAPSGGTRGARQVREVRVRPFTWFRGIGPGPGATVAELSFLPFPRPPLGPVWRAGLALFFWPGNRRFREQQSTAYCGLRCTEVRLPSETFEFPRPSVWFRDLRGNRPPVNYLSWGINFLFLNATSPFPGVLEASIPVACLRWAINSFGISGEARHPPAAGASCAQTLLFLRQRCVPVLGLRQAGGQVHTSVRFLFKIAK